MKLRLSEDYVIDTDDYCKEGLRIAVLAMSGHGKSNAAADVVEDILDQKGQVIVLEPITEWHTLTARYDNVVAVGMLAPFSYASFQPKHSLNFNIDNTNVVRLLQNQQSVIRTGGVKLIQIDGKYNVWTKKIGNSATKMLTLHGGPGFTHEYFECFEDFLPQEGIEFYYYDQLGSTYSDQPKDKSLWVVDRFRDEVEQVRAALGLDDFYLYGQSWGGMLGIEYALKHQHHLKALIISNMTASIGSYVKHINELRQKFPPEIRQILEKYEDREEYNAPEYQDVMFKHLYAKHICRLDPWPEPLMRGFKHLNTEVYNTMQGPNEFVVTGTFKDWNRWNDLQNIRVPTLLIVGRYDTMSIEDIQKMGELIPNSRVVVCENGSHVCMYDDQEAYFRELLKFIKDVETDRFSK